MMDPKQIIFAANQIPDIIHIISISTFHTLRTETKLLVIKVPKLQLNGTHSAIEENCYVVFGMCIYDWFYVMPDLRHTLDRT